jgi:RNA ligase
MHYQFPTITDIDEVRRAVNRANARVETPCFAERNTGDGYIVFDYVVNVRGLFQDLTGDEETDREIKIVRECRGLIFDAKTGQIIARGYHKFFNVNERDEVWETKIDLKKPFIVVEKLDGSMLRPVRPFDKRGPNDPIHWGTMMGWTEIAAKVDDFVNKSALGYKDLVYHCESVNMTPIFEWCSRKQPIVIDYAQDALTLTGMRHNVTGEYVSYAQLVNIGEDFNVPVVQTLNKKVTDIKSFIKYVRGIKNMEGYIIRWDDGHMVKLKGDEYCFLHNSKEVIQQEKDVVQKIVEKKADDLLPALDKADALAITNFQADFHRNVSAYAKNVLDQVNELKLIYPTKKQFVLEFLKPSTKSGVINPMDESLYTRSYDGQPHERIIESVMWAINLHMHSGPRIDTVRHYWGNLQWNDYRIPVVDNSFKARITRWFTSKYDALRMLLLVK